MNTSLEKREQQNSSLAPILAVKGNLIQSSISANTRLAYQRAWDRWRDFRHCFGADETDTDLASFITYMHEVKGLSKSTIALTISGVRFVYRLREQDVFGPECLMVMRGVQRTGHTGRGQSMGVTVNVVKLVRSSLGRSGVLKEVRDALVIGLMSDGLLRASEVVVIRVSDVAAQPDGTGRLMIPRSKTDQEGAGAVVFLSSSTMNVFAKYVRMAALQKKDILIQPINRHGSLRGTSMSTTGLNKMLKALWARVFGDGHAITSHSFRIGMAQSLAERGAGLVELQNAGRWKSPAMPARYTRGQAAGRGAVARLIYPTPLHMAAKETSVADEETEAGGSESICSPVSTALANSDG